MPFNTLTFLAFFLAFFTLYYFVARSRRNKLWLVIFGSVVFYCFWDYRFLPLLVGTGLLDFFLARQIALTSDRKRKKRLVTVSVAANLCVLFVFKYAQFFVDNVVSGAQLIGIELPHTVLGIVLPVGISFYTFQSISYTVDVYRGTFRPKKNFLEFLGALTFFPHLVAGPIVRSSFILPQFETLSGARWADARQGFLLIAFGLAKKAIADMLSLTADRVFAGGEPLGLMDSWTGALAFTGQLYGDFSGYTDMAIGLALLLGFQLPKNFDLPFLSRNMVEFWRRWHISLSSWLRDYLYTPLAFRRHKGNPQVHTMWALFVTMLLCGVWHGAGWNFLVFGIYQGALLVVTTLWLSHRAASDGSDGLRIPTFLQIAFTFYLTMIGHILFRAGDLDTAWQVLRGMHAPTVSSELQSSDWMLLALIVLAIVGSHAMDYVATRTQASKRPWVLWPCVVLAAALSIILSSNSRSFIYFQF
jgi:D-alanyl-lipoteichoic acid acyltransferase DltB (MBOAT superfamily)